MLDELELHWVHETVSYLHRPKRRSTLWTYFFPDYQRRVDQKLRFLIHLSVHYFADYMSLISTRCECTRIFRRFRRHRLSLFAVALLCLLNWHLFTTSGIVLSR
jgi:hypothetical protein